VRTRKAALGVSLCEKSEQNSFQCKQMSFNSKSTASEWEHNEITFNSERVGMELGRLHLRRPVVLTCKMWSITFSSTWIMCGCGMKAAVICSRMEISPRRRPVVFSRRTIICRAYIQSLVLILFEQGWLGVLAFTVVVVMALTRLRSQSGGSPVCRYAAGLPIRVSPDRLDREPIRRAARDSAVFPAPVCCPLLVLTRDSIGGDAANHGGRIGSTGKFADLGGDCVHQVDNASAYMVLVRDSKSAENAQQVVAWQCKAPCLRHRR